MRDLPPDSRPQPALRFLAMKILGRSASGVAATLVGGVLILAFPPIAAVLGARMLAGEIHPPRDAEEWVAWGTIELAFATIALAISTFRLSRLTAQELTDARRREEEARAQERRSWAVQFNKAAVRARAAALELSGVYGTHSQGILERARVEGRDSTDLHRERLRAWDRWTTTWLDVRADYFAYLDVAGAQLGPELLNELQAKGLPTLDAARVKQEDADIISALGVVIDVIERTMLEVAAANNLKTALAEVRRQRTKK